jgi:hypothetical protein
MLASCWPRGLRIGNESPFQRSFRAPKGIVEIG